MAEDQSYFMTREGLNEECPKHNESQQDAPRTFDSVNAAYMAIKAMPDASRNPHIIV